VKISKLKDLIKLVESSKISELEISRFGTRVRISKKLDSSGDAHTPGPLQIEVPDRADAQSTHVETRKSITAPMVGTFYRTPAPDASPYVQVGDVIKPGHVVCIIEAMKVMNEIQSEVEGKVSKVLVENESPVEYGQELFLLEPVS